MIRIVTIEREYGCSGEIAAGRRSAVPRENSVRLQNQSRPGTARDVQSKLSVSNHTSVALAVGLQAADGKTQSFESYRAPRPSFKCLESRTADPASLPALDAASDLFGIIRSSGGKGKIEMTESTAKLRWSGKTLLKITNPGGQSSKGVTEECHEPSNLTPEIRRCHHSGPSRTVNSQRR